MPQNDLVLRAARGERTERTPVWMMRQAGRFDPEYRKTRKRAGLHLEELFAHPELATEISLLPKRFGVDAIIFFQDILTPLAPMGARFVFRPGPVLETPIRTTADLDALETFDPAEKLEFVGKTLANLRSILRDDLPLLGFAGAPLTLAFFLTAGGSPGSNGQEARDLMESDPAAMHRLLDKLADTTADYLLYQIESGAQAVQLFESCADLVTPEVYRDFALPYHVKIFAKLGDLVPRILFAKDQPAVDLMVESGADVLSLSSRVDLADTKRLYGDRVAFQGNVDNHLLATGTPDEVAEAVLSCLRAGRHEGHILNLGHGLLRDTPVDNVCRLIETSRTVLHDVESPSTSQEF